MNIMHNEPVTVTAEGEFTAPDHGLRTAWIEKRKAKIYHLNRDKKLEHSMCGKVLSDMIEAGWVRGLERQGLTCCKDCKA